MDEDPESAKKESEDAPPKTPEKPEIDLHKLFTEEIFGKLEVVNKSLTQIRPSKILEEKDFS